MFECVDVFLYDYVWFGLVWNVGEMSIGGTINLCVNRKDIENF
jgi:hypothetical protein